MIYKGHRMSIKTPFFAFATLVVLCGVMLCLPMLGNTATIPSNEESNPETTISEYDQEELTHSGNDMLVRNADFHAAVKNVIRSMFSRHENSTRTEYDIMYPLNEDQCRTLSRLCIAAFKNSTEDQAYCGVFGLTSQLQDSRYRASRACLSGKLKNITGYENKTAAECLSHVEMYLWQ